MSETQTHWGTTNSAQGPVDVVPHYHEDTPDETAEKRARQQRAADKAERADRRAARRARVKEGAVSWSSTGLEVAGLGGVSWGLFTQWPWIGIVAAGASLILIGMAIDPPVIRRAPAPPPTDPAFPYMPQGTEDSQ
jgi:hypothetical protein